MTDHFFPVQCDNAELDLKIIYRLRARGFRKEADWPELRWAIADVIKDIVRNDESGMMNDEFDDDGQRADGPKNSKEKEKP